MLRFIWFDMGPDVPGQLTVIAHHLVVDGVSWRILIPDFQAAFAALLEGHPIELEPVGTSFRRWAQLLNSASSEPGRLQELTLWNETLGSEDPQLTTRPLDPVRDTVGTASVLSVGLPCGGDGTPARPGRRPPSRRASTTSCSPRSRSL